MTEEGINFEIGARQEPIIDRLNTQFTQGRKRILIEQATPYPRLLARLDLAFLHAGFIQNTTDLFSENRIDNLLQK